MSENEPFGRQPKPVNVTISGDNIDVSYWYQRLAQASERNGELIVRIDAGSFRIYPRAVND